MKVIVLAVCTLVGASFFFFKKEKAMPKPPETTELRQPLADCNKETGIAKVVCLAENFKATLNDEQLAKAQLVYSLKDAKKWSNFPEFSSRPTRVGLTLGALNTTQLAAAKALMAAVLAQGVDNEGFNELEGGLAADNYFGHETGKTGTFNAGNFFIAFLGKPSMTELWALQFGGHHFAFQNTYKNGKLTGATPSFRGVEPMAAISENGRTYQPLEQERAAFGEIIALLSDAERNTAKLSNTFRDILLGPNRDGQFPTNKQGVRIGDLTKEKQETVIKAIKLYVNDLDSTTAHNVMTKYAAELADTYVAFAGSGTMNQGSDYIRIDGKSLWIEYSAQPSRDFPNTTHPHSVWRDRLSDYGGN